MKKGRILIVIPDFNEQQNIVQVIRDAQASIPNGDVLVINDCSLDNTSLRARQAGEVRVIDLPCNLGIGGAVQTGFKYAREHGYHCMVQVDGDVQHVPAEVDKLMRTMG